MSSEQSFGQKASEELWSCGYLVDPEGENGVLDIKSLQYAAAQIIDTLDAQRTPCCEGLREALEMILANCENHRLASWFWTTGANVCAEALAHPCPCQRTESDGWLNEFHRINVARQHEAFAPAHSFLGLVACVAEEIGELAGSVLGVTGEKKRKAHCTNEDILDGVADAITYLSLIADRAGCSDLQELIGSTFNMVSKRAGSKLEVGCQRTEGKET